MKHLLTILFCFFAVPLVSNAQFLGGGNNASIVTSPAYPEPETLVTASLDAYSYNTDGAIIQWYKDGIEDIEARNTREITFTTGNLGDALSLTAQITLANGQTLNATRNITPSRVDIVVEADTITPSFYRGRPLPSSGSTIRAIAVPSTGANPNNLSYKWSVNNKVLYGGALVGKNVAEVEVTQGGSILISVEVGDSSGALITKKTTRVNIHDPEILFYEDNPLRALSKNSIVSPHTLIGDEMTVRAEPFYMSSDIFSTEPFIEWEVNGSKVANPSDDPQVITLRSGGGSASFNVNFHIRNLSNLLQGAEEDFTVSF